MYAAITASKSPLVILSTGLEQICRKESLNTTSASQKALKQVHQYDSQVMRIVKRRPGMRTPLFLKTAYICSLVKLHLKASKA
uniref:Uncharacterized protein n=1 Tax=Pyxicephalus adspersus TaxID=30357 RepID=A0AAV2ZGF4_PYXAD|nr:TPA: hypothetical protein GDO54_003368 [Pyxicephalus adspersus]